MTIELLSGLAAEAVLRDNAFAGEWNELQARCPWATTFQGEGFARAWYRVYASSYAPILLVGRDDTGALSGLLALARSRSDGSLCAAGSYHAEYQCWLAGPGDVEGFGAKALALLQRSYPRAELALKYLPPGTPTAWVASPELELPGVSHREHARPLLAVGNGEAAVAWLARKKHRDRLRRLAGGEELVFEEVPNADALEPVFDRILDLYDFRQGAVNGAPSSRRDPHHRAFYLELMRVPGLLHVTVQRRGNAIVSAHINVRNGAEIALGLLAQAPWDAEHSPGVFHIQRLAQMAAVQGFSALDLTPGADAYKDRFATDRDTVGVLELRPPRRLPVHVSRSWLRQAGRRALARGGIDPERVRSLGAHARSAVASAMSPSGARAVMRAGAVALERSASKLFVMDPLRLHAGAASVEIDSVASLLAYRPGGLEWHPRSRFLAAALTRFGWGEHVATCATQGSLSYLAWFGSADDVRKSEGAALTGVPVAAAVIHGIRFDDALPVPAAAIAETVRAAVRLTGATVAFVVAHPRDRRLMSALRAAGASPYRGAETAASAPLPGGRERLRNALETAPVVQQTR